MSASINPSPPVKPTLSSLVGHLLAAKRSLSCADHLSRANDIVTATRQALVRQTLLQARTHYLLSGCDAQATVLEHLHAQLASITREADSEFGEVISGVAATEAKLKRILDGLGSTIVDSNLRPRDEEPKNLLDFVEGTGVQSLLEEAWAVVEESKDARRHFSADVAKLLQDIADARSSISACERRLQTAEADQLSALLQALEASAHDMAQNFESLVKHYDLCLNALRHTEGAGAALYQASNNDLSADQNAALAQEIEATQATVSAEDHAHMLTLLTDDAQQVEEVIDDIREGLAEMELSYSSVSSHTTQVNENYQQAVATFKLLEVVGLGLTEYTAQSQLFVLQIDDDKAKIADRQTQLREMTRFYADFLTAYDNLIIEVGRRKDVARRMKRVQDDALAKLDKLYQEDVEERELFRVGHGEFLPIDIWPGLMAPAPRYEIGLAEGDGSVPDISASAVQKAIRRVSVRPSIKE